MNRVDNCVLTYAEQVPWDERTGTCRDGDERDDALVSSFRLQLRQDSCDVGGLARQKGDNAGAAVSRIYKTIILYSLSLSVFNVHVKINKKLSCRRDAVRRSILLEISLSYSRSLKSLEMAPFDILYHFRDKARYWSKIAFFSYPTCIRLLLKGSPSENCRNVRCRNTRTVAPPDSEKKFKNTFYSFRYNTNSNSNSS